ncbi:hypothetical protein BH790_gp37 [Gordonia phage Gsput1]|uniref:Uncharacterized protein n=1 Tax=Gordonia phage Gsput1 TaxID=1622193 RepID=A0A0E3XAL7_9CAUD|nr:hypothetical protein BH790_gp37 [Gordonia phage Gsput1]AKC03062.1 hypothetical protein Gsput1_37 [Gordonia phage Gsput1]
MKPQRGAFVRGTQLLERGDVEGYTAMLSRAVANRRADGRHAAATAMLCAEADRWLGEGKLGHDEAKPIGLAPQLAAVAE